MTEARILVVDDDRLVRTVVVAALEGAGFVCEGAESALAAATAIERARFDLVLTDVDMPGVAGLSLARAVRSRRPTLPVLVMSGGAYEHEALRAGARAYLQKPFSPAAVVSIVTDALRCGERESAPFDLSGHA